MTTIPSYGHQSKYRRTKWLPEVVLPDVSRWLLYLMNPFWKTFSTPTRAYLPHRHVRCQLDSHTASECSPQKYI